MNVLIPGTGLIVLGQSWLGLAVAFWFALAAQVTACGVLIAPARIPGILVAAGAGLAGVAWLLAQWLLAARIRFLRDPGLADELSILRRHAEQALERSDYQAARSALLIALSIDDSGLLTRVLWARLLTATASRLRARRAWLRAARVDRNNEFAEEIRTALARLQAA